MLGLRFDDCSEFRLSFSFESCQLSHSSFFKLKIKNTTFRNSLLEGVDFAESDLHSVEFDKCNLQNAIFEHTKLEKADFRTSYNYTIDPEINSIKGAKFSLQGVVGLLGK